MIPHQLAPAAAGPPSPAAVSSMGHISSGRQRPMYRQAPSPPLSSKPESVRSITGAKPSGIAKPPSAPSGSAPRGDLPMRKMATLLAPATLHMEKQAFIPLALGVAGGLYGAYQGWKDAGQYAGLGDKLWGAAKGGALAALPGGILGLGGRLASIGARGAMTVGTRGLGRMISSARSYLPGAGFNRARIGGFLSRFPSTTARVRATPAAARAAGSVESAAGARLAKGRAMQAQASIKGVHGAGLGHGDAAARNAVGLKPAGYGATTKPDYAQRLAMQDGSYVPPKPGAIRGKTRSLGEGVVPEDIRTANHSGFWSPFKARAQQREVGEALRSQIDPRTLAGRAYTSLDKNIARLNSRIGGSIGERVGDASGWGGKAGEVLRTLSPQRMLDQGRRWTLNRERAHLDRTIGARYLNQNPISLRPWAPSSRQERVGQMMQAQAKLQRSAAQDMRRAAPRFDAEKGIAKGQSRVEPSAVTKQRQQQFQQQYGSGRGQQAVNAVTSAGAGAAAATGGNPIQTIQDMAQQAATPAAAGVGRSLLGGVASAAPLVVLPELIGAVRRGIGGGRAAQLAPQYAPGNAPSQWM